MRLILNKVINFRRLKKINASLREKALKGLAGFFVVMIVFTILSRAADGITIARVSTDSVQRRTIDHTIKESGTTMEHKEQAVNVLENIKIKSVNVNKGSSVKIGDVLMELDMEYIEEKVSAKEKEIKELELNISDKEYNAALAEKEQKKALNQANEDYDRALEKGNDAALKAYNAMMEAYNAWKDFANNTNSEKGSREENALKDMQEQGAVLESEYKSKEAEYESVLDAMEKEVYACSRAVENAKKESEADSSREIADMQIEVKKSELNKLSVLVETKGIISSPADGVITEVAVATGDFTPASKSFLLADLSEGIRFISQINKDQQKYVSKGDEVELILNDQSIIKNLTVDAVTQNAENADLLDVSILLESNEKLSIGETAVMQITKKSKEYAATVPLDALREEKGQKYLLLLKETETILGKELSVEKVDVTVVEKNEKYAAIQEGIIGNDQKFVTDSNKSIQVGDRVRLLEE